MCSRIAMSAIFMRNENWLRRIEEGKIAVLTEETLTRGIDLWFTLPGGSRNRVFEKSGIWWSQLYLGVRYIEYRLKRPICNLVDIKGVYYQAESVATIRTSLISAGKTSIVIHDAFICLLFLCV